MPSELLGTRLLVVDDNASCRQIIHRTTLRWKMRPVAVGSVASAIEALEISQTEKDPFRMVLLDARLPGINRLDFNSNPRNLAGISTGTILMLPSKAPAADMDHLDESAADSYLFKPILATELLQALTSLVEPPSRQGETIPVDTTEISQAATNLNILVAEDNPINQALLLRLLQKMGHSSALARNGREALELVRIHKFDLILMDVQMPEVDGLTAATAIREAEKSTGGHMPIFAITARAMKGDRELCLQAGMDGYIAKPISFKDVEKALATVLPRAATFPQAPPWSGDLALKRLGGDQELLRELCSLFLIESPKLLLKLKHAVGQGDAEEVHHAAHSIKGELGCLGAEHAMDLAKRLEIMAQESDLKEAKKLLQELDAQVLQLYTEVKEKMGVYQ
jgi:CheY-like chemotaxis protein